MNKTLKLSFRVAKKNDCFKETKEKKHWHKKRASVLFN